MSEKLIRALIILVIIVIDYTLSIVLHETGHLCLGKATGYSLACFRIGSIKLFRKNGGWKLGYEKIPGTMGQCVMLPPDSNEPEKVPSLWYHFGGGFFNILTALIALPFYFAVTNEYGKAFFIMLSALSVAWALLNLIPANMIIPNDGYNMMLALRSPADRKAMYHILQISGNTEQSIGEMPLSYFEYDENGEYTATMKLLRGYWHLDRGDLKEAERLFQEASVKDEKSIKYYRLEASRELVFCMLLRSATSDEIKAVWDDELEEYLRKRNAHSPASLRVLYAYDHLMAKDEEKAESEYHEAREMLKKASPGDAKLEMGLLELVHPI